MKTTTKALPFNTSDYECCYACNAACVGLRDRRPEGGQLEKACARHSDPKVKIFAACAYCGGVTRKGSLVIDGSTVHASCEREASK